VLSNRSQLDDDQQTMWTASPAARSMRGLRRAFSTVGKLTVFGVNLSCTPAHAVNSVAAAGLSLASILRWRSHCRSPLQAKALQAGKDGKLFDKILIANRGEVG
jgi:hypothetical protein